MEEGTKSENHLTSAAAFVEGGIQDACDDACSICLEVFSENDPSTVTGCKHEFHLQCILEWCQRSSQCPMCWQSISLKDPSSQELLDAIEQERSIRNSASRNATIFHHPTLGDFELQHLPVSATDAELEERIIQHLAAAAAMGRARHIARRGGHRNRSSAQGRPQFLVFSAQSNVPSPTRASDSSGNVESAPAISAHNETPSETVQEAPVQAIPPSISVQANEGPSSPSPSSVIPVSPQGTTSMNRMSTIQSSLNNEDRAGPSELHSFSETLKSRINAMSMRYKESITKSTRSWKERLFSRNTSATTLVSEVPGQGNSDIATLSRLMDHLELRENNANSASVSNNLSTGQSPDHGSQQTAETAANGSVNNSEIKATAAEPSAIG